MPPVKEVVRTAAKERAATAVAEKAGVPVPGLTDVMYNPRSVRAWATAAARTGVAAALSATGLGAFGKYVEELIHRFGYRRVVLIILSLLLVNIMMASFAVMAAVSVMTETVLKPLTIVASVMQYVPGRGNDTSLEEVPDRMCKPVPEPSAQLVSPPPSAVPSSAAAPPPFGEESAEETTNPVVTYVPPAAIDANGKLTDQAKELLKDIPSGADALQAESWLMYAMSHPEDDPNRTWDGYETPYRMAFTYVLRKHREADKGTDHPVDDDKTFNIEETPRSEFAEVTPLEVNMHIDPNGVYEPFRLAAATLTVSLIFDENYLVASPEQQAAAVGRMEAACGTH